MGRAHNLPRPHPWWGEGHPSPSHTPPLHGLRPLNPLGLRPLDEDDLLLGLSLGLRLWRISSRYFNVTATFYQLCAIYGINDLEYRSEVIRGRWFAPIESTYRTSYSTSIVSMARLTNIELLYAEDPLPPYSPLLLPQFRGLPLWSKFLLFGSAKIEHPGLTTWNYFRKITTYVIRVHQRYAWTDGHIYRQTDGQLSYY